MVPEISTANVVWIATALLHKENPHRKAFRVEEIFKKVKSLELLNVAPMTIKMHISSHCVADRKGSPSTHRKLTRVEPGWYKLYIKEEPYHEDRKNGNIVPGKELIPDQFEELIDWFNNYYSKIIDTGNIVEYIQTSNENNENVQFTQINEQKMMKIPKQILNYLNTNIGDRLAFIIERDGTVVLKKVKIKREVLQ